MSAYLATTLKRSRAFAQSSNQLYFYGSYFTKNLVTLVIVKDPPPLFILKIFVQCKNDNSFSGFSAYICMQTFDLTSNNISNNIF